MGRTMRDRVWVGALRDLPRAIGPSTISTGLVTFTMLMIGPSLLIYQAATDAGLSDAQIGSWFFSVFVAGAVMELVLSLSSRQPIAAGVSVTVSAFLVQTLPGFSLEEAVGAYLTYGALILLLGLTGGFSRLIRLVPQEIVMGMLAGVLLKFGTGVFRELVAEPTLVLPIVLAWLVAGRWLRRFVPPLAVALAVGMALALWLHPTSGPVLRGAITLPVATAPTFTPGAFFSLALPMLLMVLSSQNATGIGVLWALKYTPPVNAITVATGGFTMLTALLGGHGVCLGGPRSAIAAAEAAHPDPGLRYGAVVVDAVLLVGAGLFATTLVSMFRLLPGGMIRVIAGLAMLPVILQGLEQGFRGGRHRLGTLFALVIAASDVQWLGVSAVFWSLALAPVLSRLAEGSRPPTPAGAAKGVPPPPDS